MLLIREARLRQRKITYKPIYVHVILPSHRELLKRDNNLSSQALVNVINVQHPVVLVIHFGAWNDQNPVEQSCKEHMLLQANQMVGHLPRHADCE